MENQKGGKRNLKEKKKKSPPQKTAFTLHFIDTIIEASKRREEKPPGIGERNPKEIREERKTLLRACTLQGSREGVVRKDQEGKGGLIGRKAAN